MASLYASAKKNSASYGVNSTQINNKGLQNSGYSEYIDALSKNTFDTKSKSLKSSFATAEANARGSYAEYLDSHREKQQSVKKSVMSHLVQNDVVDLGTAVAYGMSAGLSKEDAELVGQSAYEVTRQKVFNDILKQTVSLGLDKEGAKSLAVKMGVSDEDADSFAEEIDELLKYYGNISKEYLEYLEERSK